MEGVSGGQEEGDENALSGDEEMSEADYHMQQAIEASMGGGDVNPSLDEEMFGQSRANGRGMIVSSSRPVHGIVSWWYPVRTQKWLRFAAVLWAYRQYEIQ